MREFPESIPVQRLWVVRITTKQETAWRPRDTPHRSDMWRSTDQGWFIKKSLQPWTSHGASLNVLLEEKKSLKQSCQEKAIYKNPQAKQIQHYSEKTSKRPKIILMELGSSSTEMRGTVHKTIKWCPKMSQMTHGNLDKKQNFQ